MNAGTSTDLTPALPHAPQSFNNHHAPQLGDHSTDTVAELDAGCRLYNLPQELQDIIFEYAYPQEDDLNIVFKNTWDLDEQHNRKTEGPSYVRKPFPSPKVDEWMVSKGFFKAAAKAWMGAQTFHERARYPDVFVFTISDAFLEQENKLFCEFGTQAAAKIEFLSYMFLPAFAQCQNLKRLKVLVDERFFDSLDRHAKLPWEEVFTDAELSTVSSHCDIVTLQRLESMSGTIDIEFEVTSSHFLDSSSKREVLAENFNRLLNFARQATFGSLAEALESPPKLLETISSTHDTALTETHLNALLMHAYQESIRRSTRTMNGLLVFQLFSLAQAFLIAYLMPSPEWALFCVVLAATVCVLWYENSAIASPSGYNSRLNIHNHL